MTLYRPRYPRRVMAPTPEASEPLTRLVYELLDAHDDTARIANGQHLDPRWQAHLSYLRDLQRVARGLVARTGQQEDAQTSAPVDCFAPSGGSILAFPASSDSTTAGRHRPRDSSNREGGVR
jgi:hypothetical protein